MYVTSCSAVSEYMCCSERQRPERLISRLKSVGDDIGPKMVVTRQPRGPDGTKGFKQPRKPWKPAPT